MGILHSMVQLLLEKWDTRGKKKKQTQTPEAYIKDGGVFWKKRKGTLCLSWALSQFR